MHIILQIHKRLEISVFYSIFIQMNCIQVKILRTIIFDKMFTIILFEPESNYCAVQYLFNMIIELLLLLLF